MSSGKLHKTILSRKKGKKIKTLAKAKKECWTEFSKYIRLRDCIKTTGGIYDGICISCGKRVEFKKLQAGHFIPGRHSGNLYSERFVNAQCWQCNAPAFLGGKNGNTLAYRKAMIKMYGPNAEEEAEAEAAREIHYKVFEIEELKEEFKLKYKTWAMRDKLQDIEFSLTNSITKEMRDMPGPDNGFRRACPTGNYMTEEKVKIREEIN